jgi:hypothetical protein
MPCGSGSSKSSRLEALDCGRGPASLLADKPGFAAGFAAFGLDCYTRGLFWICPKRFAYSFEFHVFLLVIKRLGTFLNANH